MNILLERLRKPTVDGLWGFELGKDIVPQITVAIS